MYKIKTLFKYFLNFLVYSKKYFIRKPVLNFQALTIKIDYFINF